MKIVNCYRYSIRIFSTSVVGIYSDKVITVVRITLVYWFEGIHLSNTEVPSLHLAPSTVEFSPDGALLTHAARVHPPFYFLIILGFLVALQSPRGLIPLHCYLSVLFTL